jgi:hypothetical protein
MVWTLKHYEKAIKNHLEELKKTPTSEQFKVPINLKSAFKRIFSDDKENK